MLLGGLPVGGPPSADHPVLGPDADGAQVLRLPVLPRRLLELRDGLFCKTRKTKQRKKKPKRPKLFKRLGCEDVFLACGYFDVGRGGIPYRGTLKQYFTTAESWRENKS